MLGQLRLLFPQPEFLQHVPPMGLLEKPEAVAAIADFLAFHKPHYTLLAMGAPRSEIVAERCARDGRFGGVSLCIGASIEFLTGDKTRAPRLVQRLSLEWAHRLISEPRRLWRRYLVDGPRIITIFLRGGLRD
jgi:exopolysaccharide biosynthesis WecB/TagA/CpsF family protein